MANGEKAIDIYRSGSFFYLIFMDMEISIMDGPKVHSSISASSLKIKIKIKGMLHFRPCKGHYKYTKQDNIILALFKRTTFFKTMFWKESLYIYIWFLLIIWFTKGFLSPSPITFKQAFIYLTISYFPLKLENYSKGLEWNKSYVST